MTEEARSAVAERPHAVHLRVRAGLRKPHNWMQLMKFCAVGASGYVVNLCVFAAFVELLDAHHLVAATAAFVVAVLNNFWWNRHWTFRARGGRAGFQAARFFTVSVGGVHLRRRRARAARERRRRGRAAGPGDLDHRRDTAQLHREQDVELPHRALARLSLVAALLALAALLAAAGSPRSRGRPASGRRPRPTPPRFFEHSAREVERIAARADKVREARRDGALDPTAYTKGIGRWQVSFFRDGSEIVQVQVDDRSGAMLEQWSGDQVAWTMARGYPGAFGRKLNAPYVWIPLCLLFLAPFVDVRRPLRLLHLDLLVLLALRRVARVLQPGRDRRLRAAGLSGAAVSARAHAVRRLPTAARRRDRWCRTRR